MPAISKRQPVKSQDSIQLSADRVTFRLKHHTAKFPDTDLYTLQNFLTLFHGVGSEHRP
jgi:hypothetical protein